jgi:hypothetical protein
LEFRKALLTASLTAQKKEPVRERAMESEKEPETEHK